MFKYVLSTIVKNEHDYMNQFLEHHINIGFDFFYIIVDNLTYTQIDYMSVIADEFKDKIKLYYLDINFVSESWKNNLANNIIDYNIFIKYFNMIVFPNIDAEWLFIGAPDSFVYFNNLTIDEFTKNIREDVTQIAIPWVAMFNQENLLNEDFCHNLDNLYNVTHNHTYAFAKISNITGLSNIDHFFNSKNNKQIIYSPINDTYIETSEKDLVSIVFPKSTFDLSMISKSNVFALHIMLRSYDEIIIKDYFSWKIVNENNKIALQKLIKYFDFNNYKELSKSNRCNSIFYKTNKVNCKLNIKDYKYKNTTIYSELIINKLLSEINSNIDEYNLFKNNIKLKLKNDNII